MSQVLVNTRRPLVLSPLDGDPRAFHRRLPGYRPTPLVAVPALAADLGLGALWVKDESSRFELPAFKVLGASWAGYRALLARLGLAADVDGLDLAALAERLRGAALGPLSLAAATDGNHGRAVARVARLLGLGAVILVPAGTAQARIEAIAGEGAEVRVVDGTYDDAVEESAALAADDVLVISDTSWPGYRDVPGWVIDAYSTIFVEVDEQLAAMEAASSDGAGLGHLDVIVVQMGVGALAAAAVNHVNRPGGGAVPVVMVVEPDTADCGLLSAAAGHPVVVPGPHRSIMAGLNCGTVSPVAWPTLSAGVDVFVSIGDGAAERAMCDLAGAGLAAGETGAAGLAGLRAAVEHGDVVADGARVLVLCTEGPTDPAAYARIVGADPPTEVQSG